MSRFHSIPQAETAPYIGTSALTILNALKSQIELGDFFCRVELPLTDDPRIPRTITVLFPAPLPVTKMLAMLTAPELPDDHSTRHVYVLMRGQVALHVSPAFRPVIRQTLEPILAFTTG